MLINELYKEYIIECESDCKKSTIDRYDYVYKKYISPYFGKKEIEEITVRDISLWKISINSTTLSFQSKKKIYTNFSSLLNYAYRVYNIQNILHRCRGFKDYDPNKEYTIYSLDDFKKFNAVIDRIDYKLFFNILFYLGLRRGEALGLRYCDISDGYLRINFAKRKGVLSSPKTKYSYRKIQLPKVILKLLEIRKQEIIPSPKKNDFIFKFSETSIARYNVIYAKKAKLPVIKIHGFRHSNISFLCSLGFSPQAIAKRVGHKNTKEIIETYLHTYNAELKSINDKLDELSS